jgi:signal transduction histidine kinase
MSVFNQARGVRNAYDHFHSGYVAEDGELFFSRKGGYHAFYPDQISQQKNTRLPDIRITGFQLVGEQNQLAASELFEKPVWQTTAIRLAHHQNLFALSVACFDFYDASSNQLQFMLEGYDRTWRSDVRDGETSPYINVPPGDYTFRVRGANSFGVWNMEGASMGITILPPWWKTRWAYAFYLFVLIFGIWWVHKFQKERTIRMEREKSRERELMQAREIEKAYNELKATQTQLIQSEKMASLGELTAGIAHEIQNPLNFVNNFSDVNKELAREAIEELEKGDVEGTKFILKDIEGNSEKISHHGKRADAIVKGMLQHSRTSTGQKEPTDLNALADEYLRLSYHGLRAKDKTFNANFISDFDPNLPKVEVIPQDIGRVLLNLINNAFYAATSAVKTAHALSQQALSQQALSQQALSQQALSQQALSQQALSQQALSQQELSQQELSQQERTPIVTVTTKNLGDQIEISVKDNGKGIPDEIKDKIFQPFFTTKPTGQGTGLGLSLSYDIVKAHGGELRVESKLNEGTTFRVILQLNQKDQKQ